MLARNEGISQRQLADLTDIDAMSIVRILDRMEADGWVERRADTQDRLCASPRGHRQGTANPGPDPGDGCRDPDRVLAGLNVQQRDQLMALLEKCHTNLQALKPLAQEIGA